MHTRSRRLATAVSMAVITALAVGSAVAADGSSGSKNFTAPAAVPNYFSNESGPMLGGKADSRVVDPPNVSSVVPAPPQSRVPAAISSAPASSYPAAASSSSAPPSSYRAAKGYSRGHYTSHYASRGHRGAPPTGRHFAIARTKGGSHVVATRTAHATSRRAAKQTTHRAG
jgi:hypothetical protein